MSLLSGLWRKLRTLFSRSSQKQVKAAKAQQPATADDGHGIHKDLAELAAALQQPQAKSTGKSKHKQKANKKAEKSKVAAAVVSETALPESLPAEAVKAADVAAVLEAIEMPEVLKAAPIPQTAPEPVVEEQQVAAENGKPAAVEPPKPVAKSQVAQVESVATKKEEKPVEAKNEEPKAQPVAVKQEAEPPQPKKEVEKVAANPQVAKAVAPVAQEKPKPQATATNGNADAKAKAKAVTVKAPKISIPDNRLRPSSTNDPQRLARLLVSEIKLYNEKKVSEGLQNSNLYDLLKKAIDQSFEHYRTTVGEQADQSVNYFREELVKTLCDGDASKLGPNFPTA